MTPGWRRRPESQAVALVLLALSLGTAQAAEFGRARTLSGVGQPLRVEIPVERLAEGESATTLIVRVEGAQAADAGLAGREALAVEAILRPRTDGGLVAILVSPEPVRLPVADLRLTLDSVRGTQHRRLILLLPPALRPGVSPISLAGAAATGDTVTVRSGDTAGRIAQRLRAQRGYGDATLYQVLAALLQANPAAFIDGNLNRLRAGARLTVPDAAAVRAIDPAEARRLYARHMADFAAYRARTARSAGTVAPVAARGETVGAVRAQSAAAAPPSGRDELRLSAVSASDANASSQAQIDRLLDERAATQRALADAQSRVGELESTLADMRRLLERQNETLARLQNQTGVAPAALSATAQGRVAGQGAGEADGTSAFGAAGQGSMAGQPGAAAGTSLAGTAPGAAGATSNGSVASQVGNVTGAVGAGPAAAGGDGGAALATGSAGPAGSVASGAGSAGEAATGAGENPARAANGDAGGAADASASAGAASAGQDRAGAGGAGGGTPAGSTANGTTINGTTPAGSAAVQAVTGAGPSAPSAASPASPSAGAAPDATMPGAAEPHWLDRYFWPVLVLSLAFVVAVLAFVFRRRRPPHEAEAVERPLPVDFDLDLNSPLTDGPGGSRPKPPHAP